MPASDHPRWFFWSLLTLVAVVVMLALGGGAQWLRVRFFWDRSPEYLEANRLAATLQQRPLTDDEFVRALALCEEGPAQARCAGVSLVEETVKENPQRAPRTIAVLRRAARSSDAELARSAATALRLANSARPVDPAADRP